MGILTKNIPKAEQDLSNVPENLQIRMKNATKAGYNFSFDDREKEYIIYNKLRTERPEQEILQVAKIRRLKDRDNDKEYLVWYQTSRTYDYENNMVKCPQTEKIGVEDAPQTTKQKNSQNQITDVELIETHNDFYIEYSAKKLKELFDKSRNSQNITCYIGYTKPVKETGNDYMTDKKKINDQEAFINEDFEELMSLPDKKNVVNTYSKTKKSKSGKKTLTQVQEEKENKQEQEQEIGINEAVLDDTNTNDDNVSEVDAEENDDNTEENNNNSNNKENKGKLKIGSLD